MLRRVGRQRDDEVLRDGKCVTEIYWGTSESVEKLVVLLMEEAGSRVEWMKIKGGGKGEYLIFALGSIKKVKLILLMIISGRISIPD